MRTSQRLSFLAVALLVPCLAAYAKHGDVKHTSRPISGVSSNFQLLNAVIGPGEPLKIRVTLHNESALPVEFRYVTGAFIEHIRIYDARHRQVSARLNAPFLESGAEKVILQPGEQSTNVVTADLWQMYDLEPGTYELRFYYDLRLIADETLAAKSRKRYRSKDWILWDMKRYPLSVIGAEVSDATRNGLEHGATASKTSIMVVSRTSKEPEVSKNVTRLGASIEASNFPPNQTLALVSNATERNPDHSPLGNPPPQYRVVIKDNPAEMRFELTLISSDNRPLCVSFGGWPDGLGHVDWGSSWVKLNSKSRIFAARDWNFGYCEGNDCSHRVDVKGTLTGFIGYAEFGDPKEIAALPDRRLLFETTAYVCPK